MADGPVAIALRVVAVLDRLEIPYVLGGSLASSIVGEPRATADVDMAIRIAEEDVAALVRALEPEFYVSESAADDQARWIAQVADSPVLTFGEGDSAGDSPPIVNMGTHQNKVVFELNIEASERAGLSISAQLLQLSNQLNRRGP